MKKLFLIVVAALTVAACAPADNGDQTSSSQASSAVAEEQPDVLITSPAPFDFIESPLTVSGQARGTWYFEASFPVRLLDGDGNEIAVVPAQAQGDWMTTEYVPFQVELVFETPSTPTGTLVLEKDNPSGLPENADAIRIPVSFAQ